MLRCMDSEVVLHELFSQFKEDPCLHCVHFGNFDDVRFNQGSNTFKNVFCETCTTFKNFEEKGD